MTDREKLVCMAWDAMRVCLGIPPKNFTPEEVASFVSRRVFLDRATVR